MNKQKWLALLLALTLMATVFTGCGGGDATSDAASDVSAPVEDDAVEDLIGSGTTTAAPSATQGTNANKTNASTVSTKKADTVPTVQKDENDAKAKLPMYEIKATTSGKKVVTVCIDWAPTVEWMQDSIKAFQKIYPGVAIEWKTATPNLKATKLALWNNSNQAPDVMYIKPEESWPTLMNQGLLQPIDQYININDAFWGSARDTMKSLELGGKNYFIPTSITTYGSVIYNPNVFKNAGLKTPEQLLYEGNWTWDTFEQYAAKLTKKNSADPTKSVYGVHLRYPQAWTGTVGMDYVGYQNGKWVSNLQNSKMKTAIEKYKQLNDKYGGRGDDETATRQMLISGKIGMYVTCMSGALEFPDQFKNGSLVAVCMPRYSKSEPYYNASVINGYVIPKGAKNPQAGMAFATVCRGLTLECIDYKSAEDAAYTEHQRNLDKYCNNVISGVVMHFRRLERSFDWFSVVNPYLSNSKTYAAIVAELEPQFLEELNKQ